jgi:hypothetical protein
VDLAHAVHPGEELGARKVRCLLEDAQELAVLELAAHALARLGLEVEPDLAVAQADVLVAQGERP